MLKMRVWLARASAALMAVVALVVATAPGAGTQAA